ncbi:VOC family protein [Aliidiomarina iranensis]|uniref:VOC family protein n=1 Tax=Aliidiomarina iranensis TaxID=1434071 RepID=UPI001F5470D2|nr:VOC family protein [Aliidiomarina iranensis]
MKNKMILLVVAFVLVLGAPLHAEEKQRVLGFGGFFFKAEDPAALAQWYEEHLGVTKTPTTYEEEPWNQEGGNTVFGVFRNTTSYFGDAEQQWMLNFRVADLDAMVAQLRGAGIEVEVDPTEYPNGWFARLADPEGNPIQLWQEKIVSPSDQ